MGTQKKPESGNGANYYAEIGNLEKSIESLRKKTENEKKELENIAKNCEELALKLSSLVNNKSTGIKADNVRVEVMKIGILANETLAFLSKDGAKIEESKIEKISIRLINAIKEIRGLKDRQKSPVRREVQVSDSSVEHEFGGKGEKKVKRGGKRGDALQDSPVDSPAEVPLPVAPVEPEPAPAIKEEDVPEVMVGLGRSEAVEEPVIEETTVIPPVEETKVEEKAPAKEEKFDYNEELAKLNSTQDVKEFLKRIPKDKEGKTKIGNVDLSYLLTREGSTQLGLYLTGLMEIKLPRIPKELFDKLLSIRKTQREKNLKQPEKKEPTKSAEKSKEKAKPTGASQEETVPVDNKKDDGEYLKNLMNEAVFESSSKAEEERTKQKAEEFKTELVYYVNRDKGRLFPESFADFSKLCLVSVEKYMSEGKYDEIAKVQDIFNKEFDKNLQLISNPEQKNVETTQGQEEVENISSEKGSRENQKGILDEKVIIDIPATDKRKPGFVLVDHKEYTPEMDKAEREKRKKEFFESKKQFDRAAAYSSIVDYMDTKEFKKQKADIRGEIDAIRMLLEANDVKLLRDYLKNQLDETTKNIFKAEQFAWVGELIKEATTSAKTQETKDSSVATTKQAEMSAELLKNEIADFKNDLQDIIDGKMGENLSEEFIAQARNFLLLTKKAEKENDYEEFAELRELFQQQMRKIIGEEEKIPAKEEKKTPFWKKAAVALGLMAVGYGAGKYTSEQTKGEDIPEPPAKTETIKATPDELGKKFTTEQTGGQTVIKESPKTAEKKVVVKKKLAPLKYEFSQKDRTSLSKVIEKASEESAGKLKENLKPTELSREAIQHINNKLSEWQRMGLFPRVSFDKAGYLLGSGNAEGIQAGLDFYKGVEKSISLYKPGDVEQIWFSQLQSSVHDLENNYASIMVTEEEREAQIAMDKENKVPKGSVEPFGKGTIGGKEVDLSKIKTKVGSTYFTTKGFQGKDGYLPVFRLDGSLVGQIGLEGVVKMQTDKLGDEVKEGKLSFAESEKENQQTAQKKEHVENTLRDLGLDSVTGQVMSSIPTGEKVKDALTGVGPTKIEKVGGERKDVEVKPITLAEYMAGLGGHAQKVETAQTEEEKASAFKDLDEYHEAFSKKLAEQKKSAEEQKLASKNAETERLNKIQQESDKLYAQIFQKEEEKKAEFFAKAEKIKEEQEKEWQKQKDEELAKNVGDELTEEDLTYEDEFLEEREEAIGFQKDLQTGKMKTESAKFWADQKRAEKRGETNDGFAELNKLIKEFQDSSKKDKETTLKWLDDNSQELYLSFEKAEQLVKDNNLDESHPLVEKLFVLQSGITDEVKKDGKSLSKLQSLFKAYKTSLAKVERLLEKTMIANK